MSGIVLSASVRQNLLSLQSTAELLSTTQNRLATGNKVNSALDNPTNFFTAQGLNNRAGDINNLLDSIGNGVQVLQAANTGITSLQKLVDTAKSIANQVLQAPAGYSVKASATTAAPTGARLRWLAAGTTGDLTNAGTNSLNGLTYVFTPAAGTATTITVSSTVAAGNVNSIDAFNTALSVRRPWIDGVVGEPTARSPSPRPTTMRAKALPSAQRLPRTPLRSAVPARSPWSPPPAASLANRSPTRVR